tara:strand:+ start:130 stop:705 length:576 start_codon:yes stop_codon:yes gene_type:complete
MSSSQWFRNGCRFLATFLLTAILIFPLACAGSKSVPKSNEKQADFAGADSAGSSAIVQGDEDDYEGLGKLAKRELSSGEEDEEYEEDDKEDDNDSSDEDTEASGEICMFQHSKFEGKKICHDDEIEVPSMSQLNDDLSSVTANGNLVIELWFQEGYKGPSMIFDKSEGNFKDFGANDKFSSYKVFIEDDRE